MTSNTNKSKDVGISVDDKALIGALGKLSYRKVVSIYNNALKKPLQPLLKRARTNLRRTGIKNVNKPYVGKNGKQYFSMLQGIKTSVYVGDTEDSYGKVHIMKEFRLKFFEKGTKLRKTDKGYKRGSIKPKWFFSNAMNQRSREAASSLDENISKSIIKAFNNR